MEMKGADMFKEKSKIMGEDELNAMGAGREEDEEVEAKIYGTAERQ